MTVFRRFPVLVAIIAQVLAWVAVTQIAGRGSWHLAPVWWWLIHGGIAAVISALCGQRRWWLLGQVLVPVLLGVAVLSGLPAWVSFAALAAIVLVFGGGVMTRVPLYLSGADVDDTLVMLVQAQQARRAGPVTAIDLGAGFGGPMRRLAARVPEARCISVEASPATWLIAWLLALPARLRGRRVQVRWGDLWAQDLSQVDVVYVFLSPDPMPRLWQHVLTQATPGTLLVSHRFEVPDLRAEQTVGNLHIYRVPGKR